MVWEAPRRPLCHILPRRFRLDATGGVTTVRGKRFLFFTINRAGHYRLLARGGLCHHLY